ncbi:MAG: hypothetical protein QNK04_06585 [Myxococcota bacterium]|nr:hypothetical protein [Myxococcota bacterium]
MSVKFFGQFLVERLEVDGDMVNEAAELMRRKNRSVGELAVEEGWLTTEDANRINARQRIRDCRFGELAVEMGLLSQPQVDELLARQSSSHLPIGEALVRLGHLAEDRLGTLLDEFKADQSPFETGELVLPGPLATSSLATYLIDLLPKYCMRVARLRVKLAHGDDSEDLSPCPYRAQLHVHGPQSMSIALLGDRHFARALAAGVLGRAKVDLDDALVLDNLGEFLNLLAGNSIAALERLGTVTHLEPPSFDVVELQGCFFRVVCAQGRALLCLTPG